MHPSKFGVFPNPIDMIMALIKKLFAAMALAGQAAELALKLKMAALEAASKIPLALDALKPPGFQGVPKFVPKPFMRLWEIVPEISGITKSCHS